MTQDYFDPGKPFEPSDPYLGRIKIAEKDVIWRAPKEADVTQDLGANPGSREPSPDGLGPSGFDPGRRADLQLALDWALGELIKLEPPDGRFISDEFVSAAAIACDCVNEECREILRAAIAMETRRAETLGSVAMP